MLFSLQDFYSNSSARYSLLNRFSLYLALMKLTLLLFLISVSVFAQQKEDHLEPHYNYQKDKPVNFSDYDSIDFDWKKELFRQWDCLCPVYSSPDGVRHLPRELSPYQWIDKNKPIIIDDSTYQEWIKADRDFKKMFFKSDSLLNLDKKPTIF